MDPQARPVVLADRTVGQDAPPCDVLAMGRRPGLGRDAVLCAECVARCHRCSVAASPGPGPGEAIGRNSGGCGGRSRGNRPQYRNGARARRRRGRRRTSGWLTRRWLSSGRLARGASRWLALGAGYVKTPRGGPSETRIPGRNISATREITVDHVPRPRARRDGDHGERRARTPGHLTIAHRPRVTPRDARRLERRAATHASLRG
jgi:hypothetical protein